MFWGITFVTTTHDEYLRNVPETHCQHRGKNDDRKMTSEDGLEEDLCLSLLSIKTPLSPVVLTIYNGTHATQLYNDHELAKHPDNRLDP